MASLSSLGLPLLGLSLFLAFSSLRVEGAGCETQPRYAPIPGLANGLGQGWDMIWAMNRGPIIDLCYNDKVYWTNPLTQEKWSVPDGLIVQNTPRALSKDDEFVITSKQEYINRLYTFKSTSISFFAFGFAKAKQVSRIEQILRTGNHKIYIHERTFSAYNVQMYPYAAIEADQKRSKLQYAARALPVECVSDDDRFVYRSFINAFGTHYVPSAQFGGSLRYEVVVNERAFKEFTESWVKTQVSLWFKVLGLGFGIASDKAVSKSQIAEDFFALSNTTVTWEGGDSRVSSGNYQEWTKTVVNQPAMLHPTFAPIMDLIKMASKKECLRQMSEEYLNSPPGESPPLVAEGHPEVVPLVAQFEEAGSGPELPEVDGLDNGIGAGYDVVYERHKGPIYSWVYESERKWKNPYLGNRKELVPDQMYLTKVPTATSDRTLGTFDTFHSYETTLTKSMGLSVDLGFSLAGKELALSGSFQKSQNEIKQYTKNNTRKWGIEERAVTLYQLDIWFGLVPIAAPIQRLIRALPTAINTDRDKTNIKFFIDTFGTHIIVGAQFGGYMNFTSSFNTELIAKYGEKWVATQVGLALSFDKSKIQYNNSKNATNKVNDQSYSDASEEKSYVMGGNPILVDTQGYNAWLASVPSNPGLMIRKSRLVTLDQILSNRAQQVVMWNCIRSYILSGGKQYGW